jgi:hypothetical protein
MIHIYVDIVDSLFSLHAGHSLAPPVQSPVATSPLKNSQNSVPHPLAIRIVAIPNHHLALDSTFAQDFQWLRDFGDKLRIS